MPDTYEPRQGFLNGVHVLELADEKGEFAGRLLAGLGADVVKIEPPGGSPTRCIGPFAGDVQDPEHSLFFWHYNLGKRSAVLDLTQAAGKDQFKRLAAKADVVVESYPPGHLASLGLGYEQLKADNPKLIMVSISPFGQSGPWKDYKASDLIHLALGGEMNYTQYAAKPDGAQDAPPIAGQMWQSYHITGDHAVMAIMAAIIERQSSGQGQYIDVAIHQVASVTTEIDFPNWVYGKGIVNRFGGMANITRDGRYLYGGVGDGFGSGFDGILELLKRHNAQADLEDPKYKDRKYRSQPAIQQHIGDVARRFIAQWNMEDVWREAQNLGILWVPIRKPEENLSDEHWGVRSTFQKVDHPEAESSYTYVVGRWDCEEVPWKAGPRAPTLGEHTDSVLKEAAGWTSNSLKPVSITPAPKYANKSGKRLPLEGVRVLDLTWLLASAGGPKIFASLGAECIRVEWKDKLDWLRSGPGGVGQMGNNVPGGPPGSLNRGGYFNDINAGRMGISLNMHTEQGKEMFRKLVSISDIVVEGMSARTMDRWGFGYEGLRAIKPDIIYVQQSGMGKKGPYGDFRSVGPVAAALSGITEESGLPDPWPAVGWLYSYLDFGGAYNCALAMLSGLYHRRMTGKGVYIDSSQLEAGIYYTGTAILDHQVNGRPYSRTGNRSPWVMAAPHAAFHCAGPTVTGFGNRRWIATACFSEAEWQGLCKVMGSPTWAKDSKFSTLEARYQNQDALERLIDEWTRPFDAYELMERLQKAGVPAGVCQTAEERVERDPQLKHLGWVTPLAHTELGTWPVKTFPVNLTRTPAFQGGPINRAAPCYGEDNSYVYGSLLGYSDTDIKKMAAENVI